MNTQVALTVLTLAALLGGCLGGGTGSDSTTTTSPATTATTTATQTATSTPPAQTPKLSGSIDITGSSTVYPVGQAWAEEFQIANPDVRIAYNVLGTGGGFKAFCRGEAPLTGASRPIKSSETSDCGNNTIAPYEIQVAIDGLAIVVSTQNSFAQDITVAELNRIWTADASKQANYWDDLRPSWPHEGIVLYGPGTDSGTFDYFVEVIIHPFDGSSTKGRSDYTPSEDDNLLVKGIAASPYALGYFGLAYVHENADKIRAIPVDEGKGAGPIAPTAANVEGGKYSPLARPIFYYTNGQPAGIVKAFLEFGLGPDGQALVEEVGYIKMPAPKLTQMRAKVSG